MTDETKILEAKAGELAGRELEWNELDFVGWKEFRRMTPAVVGLEVGRIERLIAAEEVGSDVYNALVDVRFSLRQFVKGLDEAAPESLAVRAEHLRRALLGISILSASQPADVAETLRYVLQRLSYINHRMDLIY